MARRIGLAQALINDPDLLILDEPTTGLDPIGTRQIKDLILKLAQRGKTVLLCSHLLADVEDVCDRIAILYGGKIQAEGLVRDMLQQTDKREIVTGFISDAAVEKIKQIAREELADCVVSSPMDKLETFFIKTVAAAQQQAQPTAGAVSTTEIGDFLAPETAAERILDKLVSAEASERPSAAEPPSTQQVVAAEPSRRETDEQVLSKLTEPAQPPEPKPVTKDGKAPKAPIEVEGPKPDQVRKHILDQLTRPISQETNEEQTDKPDAGEPRDA
jgi:ABC-2 type transport system ATP-binding protein